MRRSILRAFFAVTLLALLSVPTQLRAVDVDVGAVDSQAQETNFRLSADYAHRFTTDIDHNGNFDVDTVRVRGGFEADLADELSWDNTVMYQFDSYDFNKRSKKINQNVKTQNFAWDNTHMVNLVSLLKFRADRWSLFGGGLVRFWGEDGAELDDTVTSGGLVGFSYAHSRTLVYGLGIAVMSRLEDNIGLVPIPMLDWQFADDWKLHLGLSEVGARSGLGGEVTWALSPDLALTAGGQFQRSRFRLDDEGHPEDNDGVAEDTSFPIFAKLGWKTCDAADLELLGALVTGGEMRVENRNGKKRKEQDYDPTGMIGVRLVTRF